MKRYISGMKKEEKNGASQTKKICITDSLKYAGGILKKKTLITSKAESENKMKTLRLDRGQIEVIDDKVAEIMKTKSGQERLNMVWDAWTYFDKRIRVYLKNRHPEWTERQIQKEIVNRVTYGTK